MAPEDDAQLASRSDPGREPSQSDRSRGTDDAEARFPEVPGYDLVDEIGRGGMGVVYEAYQRSTGRKVAIKFMRGLGRDLSLRFEREIDLLARLSIPGVVAVIDSGVHNGRWYYVMEHVDGVPLDQRVAPGSADIRQTLGLVAAVADVVNSAHERGVLHRDLKPSNILVEEDGRVRLLDFGLAKAVDPDTGVNADITISEPGRPMGTLAYMPPEQAAGQGASVRSDVYAIGVIAFYLLTGRIPIEISGTLVEAVERIRTAPIPRASTLRQRLNADIDAILAKATRKLPADRYASAAELAADIRRHLDGRPITARPLSGPVRAWRWAMRNKVLVGVVGGASVALLAMGVASFVRVVQERDRANALLLETFAHFRQVDRMEDVARQRAAAAERVYGKRSRLYVVSALQHALVLERLQRYVEAEQIVAEALGIMQSLRGISEPDLSLANLYMGRILGWSGRYEEAITYLELARALAHKTRLNVPSMERGAGLVEAHASLFLGNALSQLGRHSQGITHLEKAWAWWTEDPAGRDDGWYSGAVRTYADCLLRLGRTDDAERVLTDALERASKARPFDVDRRLRFVQTLADFYAAIGRVDEAKALAEEVQRAVAGGRTPFAQSLNFPEMEPGDAP